MKPWQKTVRYCAIAFAIVIMVNIVFWGLSLVGLMFGVASPGTSDEATVYSFNADGIENLEIEVSAARFTFDTSNGDKIIVKSNIEKLTAKEDGKTVKIKEKQRAFAVADSDAFIDVTVPLDFAFKKVEIFGGAGMISINGLNAEKLDLDLGAGDTSIDRLKVLREADIDGGAGNLTFTRTEITGLDLDMGVGFLSMNCVLNGENSISLGVGETVLGFYDEKEKYYFDVENGIGEIEFHGTGDTNFERNGQETTVKIEGGIGKISVGFFDKPDNW
jgi:hypothetical protein